MKRLKKGDTVIIRSGKFKNKTGKIIAVHPKKAAVTVEGINIAKRHLKPTKEQPRGGIVDITKPLHLSKVSYYDTLSKKASRIGYQTAKSGKKTRVLKKSGKEIK